MKALGSQIGKRNSEEQTGKVRAKRGPRVKGGCGRCRPKVTPDLQVPIAASPPATHPRAFPRLSPHCHGLGVGGTEQPPGARGLGFCGELTVCRPGEEQGCAQGQGCGGAGGHAGSASSASAGLVSGVLSSAPAGCERLFFPRRLAQ